MIELSIKDVYVTKDGKSQPINLQIDMSLPKPVRFMNEANRVYAEFSREQWAVMIGAIQSAFDTYSDLMMDIPEEDE